MNCTPTLKTHLMEQSRQQLWSLPETGWKLEPDFARLEALAAGYEPVSLDEMDAVALLDRTDTKFVMTSGQLINTLAALQNDYQMLSVCGQRLNHYRTLYFDTPGFDLFHQHVNGRANRYKVRSREYTDTGLSFLEVKHRTPKGRTIKDRAATQKPVERINGEACAWLRDFYPYNSQALEPKLWNTFTRITLVSMANCERVTLDLDLSFYTDEKIVTLAGVVVGEVKLCSARRTSPFVAQMRSQRVHQQGFSKYCIGAALLNERVKKNAVKPQMIWLEKMIAGRA